MNELHMSVERADLYALGMLDESEREQCDRHAARCATCANALAEASAIIEAIELRSGIVPAPPSLREGRRRSSRRWSYAAGLCASVAIALILLARVIELNGTVHHDDVAFVALVHSHFNHAPFIAQRADAPAAKVMYAQNGNWLFVVVDHPEMPLTIEGIDVMGHASELGRIERSSSAQRAFARPAQRIIRLELLDTRGAAVARANLAYRK